MLMIENFSAVFKLRIHEPKEGLGENYQDQNCAYANSTGAISTLSVFTQFLLRFIASRVSCLDAKRMFDVSVIGLMNKRKGLFKTFRKHVQGSYILCISWKVAIKDSIKIWLH